METVIDRSLVHKESSSANLLSSATRLEAGHWRFEVQLPAGISPSPHLGCTTILAAELIRQTAIAFAHLDGDVPMDSAFLLHELSFAWCRGAFELEAGTSVDSYLDVRIHASRMRKNQLSELQLTGTLLSGDDVLGVAHGDLSCISRQTYKAIRRNAPAVDECNTGELGTDLEDVDLQGRHLRAHVVWNWDDKFIFDHFSDHVPGMLLGRAALVAHEVLTGAPASAISLQCGRFGEFNSAVELEAVMGPDNRTDIAVTQGAATLATATCVRDVATNPEASAVQFQRTITTA